MATWFIILFNLEYRENTEVIKLLHHFTNFWVFKIKKPRLLAQNRNEEKSDKLTCASILSVSKEICLGSWWWREGCQEGHTGSMTLITYLFETRLLQALVPGSARPMYQRINFRIIWQCSFFSEIITMIGKDILKHHITFIFTFIFNSFKNCALSAQTQWLGRPASPGLSLYKNFRIWWTRLFLNDRDGQASDHYQFNKKNGLMMMMMTKRICYFQLLYQLHLLQLNMIRCNSSPTAHWSGWYGILLGMSRGEWESSCCFLLRPLKENLSIRVH